MAKQRRWRTWLSWNENKV